MSVTDLPLPAVPHQAGRQPATALQWAIAECTKQGWRLQSATVNTASMVYGNDINHALHGILSVFTCGAWLLIWLFIVASNRKHNMLILVDEQGNITYQQSP